MSGFRGFIAPRTNFGHASWRVFEAPAPPCQPELLLTSAVMYSRRVIAPRTGLVAGS